MPVGYPGMKRKKGVSRFGWKKIRIPYYVLRTVVVLLVLALIGGGGSIFWARYRGEESAIGRVLSIVTKKVDERVKLLTARNMEEEILSQRFATLTFYSGSVEVQRSSELRWKGAVEKMQLESGDRVRTFSNSRAEITFDEGNVLRVKPDSLIVIGDLTENVRTKVRKSSVKLLVSSIEADIKKSVVRGSQFRLEMPTAVADIEKARFSVDINEEKQSQVRVFEGKVGIDTGTERIELDDRKTIMISALKKLTRPENLLPAPRMKSPRPLQRFFTNAESLPVDCEWQAVKGALAYRVQVATDRYFDKVVFSETNVQKTKFLVPELGGNVFFIRVTAVDSKRMEGDYSEPVPVMVIIDRVPPHLEVTKFVVLRSGGSREVLVNGQTEPFAEVVVGGRSVSIDDSGFFSAVVKRFSPGQKEIEIVAKDRAGNVSNLRKAVSI
jgi:hypothetical protein